MAYDLVVRGGTIVDGSGGAPYPADIGVRNGRIARVGRIREQAGRTIDADGLHVAPGFVDGHTHMDAQVCWDPLGTSSCYHGVTSVVMGNCGFTLAPCRERDKALVLRNLERAEDISAEAMEAGIKWSWATYPEYLDRLDALPKGINYSGYVGHSALRTHVMGERAFTDAPTADELEAMKRELVASVRAGALGFTTSRTHHHQTPDGQPVASRVASWDEVRALVAAMGETGAGIFEIAGEDPDRDPERIRDYLEWLRDLAVDTGVTVTWGIFSIRGAPDYWRQYMELLDETAAAGGRMFAQVHSRALNAVLSFETNMPFDHYPVWRELRSLPLEDQKRRLRDPELRAKLVESAKAGRLGGRAVGAEPRRPDYDWILALDKVEGPHPSLNQVAKARGLHPADAMIELSLEKDLKQLFLQPLANEDQDHVLEMMRHPRSAVTFSDSGAHVSQIMDSSLQTHVLAHWVREKGALTLSEAVRMLSFDIASAWGFSDRGLVREGFAADLVAFDPDQVAPLLPEVVYDLPGGARRYLQKSRGIEHSIVNGEPILRGSEPTGALPGRVLRGPLAAG